MPHHPRPTLAIMIAAMLVFHAGDLSAQRRGGRVRGAAAASPRAARSSGSSMTKHEVKDAKKKLAVCNDGSPIAYYFKAGEGANQRKWVIFLQGGEGCATDEACSERWKNDRILMTSDGQRPTDEGDGILSNDTTVNPDFATFNHVRVHYCTSDAWAGDGERTIDGRTFQFRGHRAIDAVLDDLMDASVVGASTLRDATDVIFSGSSAGGMGVQNNLDRVAARVSWASVKGIADSGWVPDIEPLGPGSMGVRPDRADALAYYHALPDESCMAANPGQEGRCLLGSFEFKYITTPMFVYVDQRDPSHLGTLGALGGRGPEQQAYIQRYMELVRESLQDVPAAFSPILGKHMALQNERFQGAVIDGHTFAEVLGNWYFGRTGPVKLVQEEAGGRGRGRGRAR